IGMRTEIENHGFLEGSGAEKWLQEIGVSDAPVTRNGLSVSLHFFHVFMPTLPRLMRLNFLRGMDLHKPVRMTHLTPPARVAAYRKLTEDPQRLFYTKAGTSVRDLGLNPSHREFRKFSVFRPCPVLESRCSPAVDSWTDPSRAFVA